LICIKRVLAGRLYDGPSTFLEEKAMHSNVGDRDRIIRIIAGVCILGAFFVLEGNARWLALIGVIPLVTGLVRWCPAYKLLGLSTRATAHTTTN
jgi:hypothetical protein